MIIKGPASPPVWLRREWAAAAAAPEARLVRIMLQRGAPSLPNEQYQMFKVTRERFDPEERQRQAFRNANMTYHVDQAAKEAALEEAADASLEARTRLPGPATPHLVRLKRYPVVLTHTATLPHHRQLEGETTEKEADAGGALALRIRERELLAQPPADSLKYPNLLNVNPEEERYDFDDPFMHYMYEIMRPENPSPDHFVSEKGSEEPEFTRTMRNQQYMDEVGKKYGENYLHLLKRPSPARFVAEEWGGSQAAFPQPGDLSAMVEEKLMALQKAKSGWEEEAVEQHSETESEEEGDDAEHEEMRPTDGSARSISGWFSAHFFRKAPLGRIIV